MRRGISLPRFLFLPICQSHIAQHRQTATSNGIEFLTCNLTREKDNTLPSQYLTNLHRRAPRGVSLSPTPRTTHRRGLATKRTARRKTSPTSTITSTTTSTKTTISFGTNTTKSLTLRIPPQPAQSYTTQPSIAPLRIPPSSRVRGASINRIATSVSTRARIRGNIILLPSALRHSRPQWVAKYPPTNFLLTGDTPTVHLGPATTALHSQATPRAMWDMRPPARTIPDVAAP